MRGSFVMMLQVLKLFSELILYLQVGQAGAEASRMLYQSRLWSLSFEERQFLDVNLAALCL
jgi:hypothetical protein